MPRYIDAELLDPEEFENCTPYQAREIIESIPTADVVPKSEYDNLKMQFDALDCECDRLEKAESEKHDKIIEAKAEVAREIFEELNQKKTELWNTGKYTMFECWCKAEDEVKKKRTEEKK